jgi:hypothetical protein
MPSTIHARTTLPMIRFLASALVVLACLAGCGRDSGGPGTLVPVPSSLPGVYTGTLPCSNCPSIAATLWLRNDGRFFLRQQFAGENGAVDGQAYALGRWHWDPHAGAAVLKSVGPERQLTALDDDRLRLRVASLAEHVLTRDPAAPRFTDRVRLDGESELVGQGAVFTECLTGLRLPVAEAAAFKELRRQHRLVNSRGKIARSSVEGRLMTLTENDTTVEVLIVDRFITLKPGTGC